MTSGSGGASADRLNSTGRDIQLSAPLRDGAFVLAEVPFTLTKDDHILVNAPQLLIAVKAILDQEKFAALSQALSGQRDVPIEKLAELGYTLTYDPQAIGLTIAIPPEARTHRDVRLAELGETFVGAADPPAAFSGYINLRSSVDYQWQGIDRGFQSPLIETDWAFRLKGIVLEGEGTLAIANSNVPTEFRREGTRFVYDDQRLVARFTAGDLLPISRGFSGSSQMAGFSISRTYSVLQPQRNVQPRGDRTFTLVRASTVEAFINGQSVRQIRLNPGTYNVRDFPFVQGANDVQLLITDDAGARETVDFSLFFDRTLLEKGLTEFGLYAGVLAPTLRNGRDYRFDQPAANGYFRRGLTDTITAGANFSAQRRGATGGVEMIWASPLGTLSFDLAGSHVKTIGSGYALNVAFQRTFGGQASRGRSFALTFETRSKDFATPSAIAADNRYSYEVGATYSQSIGELQFVSVDGRFSKGRAGFADERSARLAYGYRLSTRLNFQAEGIYDDRSFGGKSWGIRASLTLRMGRRSTATAEFDTRNNRGRIGYQTSSGQGVGATSLSGSLDYGEGSVGFDGGASYTANRFELSAAHTTAFDQNGFSVTDQRTSLRVGTAIVFAGGRVALSRPIYDSFALVVPYKTLNGSKILLNPVDGKYTATSGFFGGAVANDLSSYSDRVVPFDVPNAPVGYDLGNGNLRAYPPYKSGYLKVVGSSYSVTAIGTLRTEDGLPISLLAGQATELALPDRPPITVFTNREGRFGISGLRPGKWRIDMPTEPESSVIIDVPDSAVGIVRLGDVTLKGTP